MEQAIFQQFQSGTAPLPIPADEGLLFYLMFDYLFPEGAPTKT